MFLLLLTMLLFPAASTLRCYSCPKGANTVNHQISSSRFPSALNGCTLESNTNGCSASLQWNRSPTESSLWFESLSTSKADTLQLDIFSVNVSSTPRVWASKIQYTCSNHDECNSPDELKRLLDSLAFNPNFASLEAMNLAKPPGPVSNPSCDSFQNWTDNRCAISGNCFQCLQFSKTMSNGTLALCSFCGSPSPKVAEGAKFTSTILLGTGERTDTSEIYCRAPNCNTPDKIAIMSQAANINFDYIKFATTTAITTTNDPIRTPTRGPTTQKPIRNTTSSLSSSCPFILTISINLLLCIYIYVL